MIRVQKDATALQCPDPPPRPVMTEVAANKKAANLLVWLVALPWESGGHINDNIITRGWADPQYAESLRESKPLTAWLNPIY